MKKFFLAFLLAQMIATGALAQNDVTTFIGIPVDGLESTMRQKLIDSGFRPRKVLGREVLRGEYNGNDVDLHVIAANDVVYRIMLCERATVNADRIREKFNSLVSQFENDPAYMTPGSYSIPGDEDIVRGMREGKHYDALYYQSLVMEKLNPGRDLWSQARKKAVWFRICEHNGRYYITTFFDNEYNRPYGLE